LERFTEVKVALFGAIDEINITFCQMKKASEQYYFPDKELVSWRVTCDVCVAMQDMANSLDKSAHALREVIDGPVHVPSGIDWEPSEDSDDYCGPHFDDPYDIDTNIEC
jgi:hypothetical protein